MASSTVPGWVESLRIVLRESVGPSYSVMEQAGKCRLQVRFRNGNRKTTTLDYEWQKGQVEFWLRKHGFSETNTPY